MRSVLVVVSVLCGGIAYGQNYGGPLVPIVPNQQQVASVPLTPVVPPINEWRAGVHEEWRTIHEIRPVQQYDLNGQQQYPQQQYQTYPQQQYQTYPQQQVYYQTCPRQQVYPQCQQYYYQPSSYCWW